MIIDELHAFATTKRGHHLALCLARLAPLAPQVRFVGLSATVADPPALADLPAPCEDEVEIVQGEPGAQPEVSIIDAQERLPWGGHMGHHAVPEVYNIIRQHKTSIVFVNTRAQAELVFDGLWRINEDNLAIGLHHGSLAVEQRRKVEAAMAAGKLRAVVATSSLDLGIDWGDVDLVIQMGAPKGVSRLMQRIGRANHRLDEPSRAMIAPANRFEVLELLAALEADRGARARRRSAAAGLPRRAGPAHRRHAPAPSRSTARPSTTRCAAPQPYRDLPRKDFDDTFDFVATGGYALAAYERWHRLKKLPDGRWMLASPLVARQFRMNVGTIVELPLIKVKLRRGPVLGEVEEAFIQGLVPGDTFVFAGRLLRFEGVKELVAQCSPATGGDPKVPAYGGGRLPLSTFLAEPRARHPAGSVAASQAAGRGARMAATSSASARPCRASDSLLIEGFPRGSQAVHRRLLLRGPQRAPDAGHAADPPHGAHGAEAAGLRRHRLCARHLGPAAADQGAARPAVRRGHAGRRPRGVDGRIDHAAPLVPQRRGDRRPDRAALPGRGEVAPPGHLQLRPDLRRAAQARARPHPAARHPPGRRLAARRPARLGELLRRAKGRIEYRRLDRISPLAVPVLLEIGKERVLDGTAEDELLDIAAQELIDEATRLCDAIAGGLASTSADIEC